MFYEIKDANNFTKIININEIVCIEKYDATGFCYVILSSRSSQNNNTNVIKSISNKSITITTAQYNSLIKFLRSKSLL